MKKLIKIQIYNTLVLINFILVNSFSSNARADVAYNIDEKSNYIAVYITEKTLPADLDKFKQIDSYISNFQGKRKSFYVVLDSVGGDMKTAIEIGRIMRKNDAIAMIKPSEKCYSACVFILAGAPSRIVYGLVGIHRPYKADDKATLPKEQKLQQQKTELWAKSYLDEMNVPQSLYDDLMRVPPEKNKILTESELSKYGLNENDPYYNDAMVANVAKKLGITSEEVLKRKVRAEEICLRYQDAKKVGDCYIKITRKGQMTYP